VYSWKEYWDKVASSYGGADPRGFAPVLHPGAPEWFNSTIDRLQEKSWRRGLGLCKLSAGARALDVGCGTGRWLRRYQQMGVRAVGLDATQDMLRRAITGGLKSPLVAARAQKLPFQDSTFDLVSDVTVVQHISSPEQQGVLNEMVRVLRPGGHLLLIELIKGEAPHIFPRNPQDWIRAATNAELKPIYWQGQEFLLFDQAFVQIVQAIRRLASGKRETALPARDSPSGEQNGAKSAGRSLYWAMRRIACKPSEWAEPLVQKTCPARWATHALFVFEKQGAGQ
jgi:ubiquinone/menaquinone biosynthesis C-methylase UbiE